MVDQLLELPAGLEVSDALGRHVDAVAGLRVAARAREAAPGAEAAEAAELDPLAPVQRIDDAAKHGVDDNSPMLLREVGDVGQFLHECRLRQSAFGHWLVFRQKGIRRGHQALALPAGDDQRGEMIAAAGR